MAYRVPVTEYQVKVYVKRRGQVGPRTRREFDIAAFDCGAAPSLSYHSCTGVSAPDIVTATRQRQTVDADATGTIQNPGLRGEGSEHVRVTVKERIAR
jgi:hypothetical protein